jgi:putative ABC transport system permease protein
MRWIKNAAAAYQVVVAQPVRTLLLVVPVAVSTALMLATLAVDRGVHQQAADAAANFGPDLVTIHGSGQIIAGKFSSVSSLRERDLDLLRSKLRGYKHVVGTRRNNEVDLGLVGAPNGERGKKYKVFGVTPEWFEARSFPAGEGRVFNAQEYDEAAKVCVVGLTIVREVFGGQNPIGRTLYLNKDLGAEVVGVLVDRGASPAEGDRNARVVMPMTTFSRYLFPSPQPPLDQIVIQLSAPTTENLTRVAQDVTTDLRKLHGLEDEGLPNDFTVRTPMSVAEESRAISQQVLWLLLGLAAVLAVSVAVVIGLVFQQTIRTRQGEIGIRRALGATPTDILQQIGVEGLLVSLLGGVFGFGVGMAATWGLMNWRDLPINLDLLVLGISAGVALLPTVAGLIPARAAAQLDPAVALRPAA